MIDFLGQLLGSLALISNATESRYQPNFEEINYLLMTPVGNVSIPLHESTLLWANAMFNWNLKVVVVVTGWTTDLNYTNGAAGVIYEAYRARGDSNFIVLDTARYIDTLYTWSAFNTQLLGDYLGDALADLIGLVPLDRIHLIG
jgi:lipoprotein lipase